MSIYELKLYQQEFAELIAGKTTSLSGQMAPGGLQIYMKNYIARLTRALALNYPTVELLLGKNYFAQFAKIFIAAHPSQQANLKLYGAEFSNFLRTQMDLVGIAYVVDVARFEWLSNVMGDNQPEIVHFDYPILDILDFCRATNPTELILKPQPCCLRMEKKYNQLFCQPVTT